MTVAIYQATSDGLLRLGTFTARGAPSIRNVASQFYAKHPNLEREGML